MAEILNKIDWKSELNALREKWYLTNHAAARDFGVPLPKPYRDDNTNGLTRSVCDYLKFAGNYANRVNTVGRVRVEKVQLAGGGERQNVHWQKGNTNKGAADINAIINGRAVQIEIKTAATKDKVRPNQVKEQARVEKAGGVYWLVTSMPNFLEQYKAFINDCSK